MTPAKTIKRNINIVIASLAVALPSTAVIESGYVEIQTFDDDCVCMSDLLSIKDKVIYLIVPVSLCDFVIPLIHDHVCIERICLYQDLLDEQLIDSMKDYSKVRGINDSVDMLVKQITEDIDCITRRDFYWSNSETLLTALCTQAAPITILALADDASEYDRNTWRIVILHLDHHQMSPVFGKENKVDEFYDISECIVSIINDNLTSVFLIVSMNEFCDIQSIVELNAVYTVYIVTDLQSMERIETASTYSKLSGIFTRDEDLSKQLTADILFYCRIRAYMPAISFFKIEPNILEKLTEHQIEFLVFQLFSDILPQLSTELTSATDENMTQISQQHVLLIEANKMVSKLLKQFNISMLQSSVSKLKKINKHISFTRQNIDLSSTTVYRAQLLSENDLNMITSNPDALLAIHGFVLASYSFETIVNICRRAVDHHLIVVLFEIKLVNEVSVAYLDSSTIVFSLDTTFRLVSINLAPDNVWRVRLEVANDSMQRIKDQLQIEIGGELTWLTFGNYLAAFQRSNEAKNYYEYLLFDLPSDQSSLTSIYNNISLVCSEMDNDNKGALEWLEQASKFNVEELPIGTEENNLPYANASSPLFTSINRLLILNKMAETNYQHGNIKTSLDLYRQALQIATSGSLRRFFEEKIRMLFFSIQDFEPDTVS